MTTTAHATGPAAEPDHLVEGEQRVTPIELFFDLVFVFGLTQVTAMLADDPTAGGLFRGLLVLLSLWWAWGGFAWLTNNAPPHGNRARLLIFGSMAAMLVAALATPRAFGDDATTFAVAYALVRVFHLGFYVTALPWEDGRRAVLRFTPTSLLGSALLVVASLLERDAQMVVWCAALLVDIGGLYLSGTTGWHLEPGHFVERYALIVIIALGESIVALGVGAEGLDVDAGVIAAAVLGVAASAAMWWCYFDVVAVVAERRLHALHGEARLRMARDSYSYLHFLMIAGVVLFALGVKKTLGDVEKELGAVAAVGLCGGAGLYLLGHIAFRWRNLHTLNRQRLVAALACLAFIPAATAVPALAALAVVAGLLVALVSYEAIHFAEARARVRAGIG